MTEGWTEGRTGRWVGAWMGGWVRGWTSSLIGGRVSGWTQNSPGFDTKIMRSCGGIHLKRTKTDRLLNRLVILVSCLEPLPWGWGGPGGWEGQRALASLPTKRAA